jgi:hypothetical protein
LEDRHVDTEHPLLGILCDEQSILPENETDEQMKRRILEGIENTSRSRSRAKRATGARG